LVHFYRTPGILRLLSKQLHWKMPVEEKELFLTFDDGPVPGLTEFVLQQLNKYNAEATFFCVGDNIRKYPDIYNSILDHGHETGNHTYNHLRAWSTDQEHYLLNVKKCQEIIDKHGDKKARPLMRPPHGHITRKLISELKHQYKIVMWDVLTYDFDAKHSPEAGLKKSIRKTRPGSIVVFHDNYKAESKLKFMLPRYLAHFNELGYKFKKLPRA